MVQDFATPCTVFPTCPDPNFQAGLCNICLNTEGLATNMTGKQKRRLKQQLVKRVSTGGLKATLLFFARQILYVFPFWGYFQVNPCHFWPLWVLLPCDAMVSNTNLQGGYGLRVAVHAPARGKVHKIWLTISQCASRLGKRCGQQSRSWVVQTQS